MYARGYKDDSVQALAEKLVLTNPQWDGKQDWDITEIAKMSDSTIFSDNHVELLPDHSIHDVVNRFNREGAFVMLVPADQQKYNADGKESHAITIYGADPEKNAKIADSALGYAKAPSWYLDKLWEKATPPWMTITLQPQPPPASPPPK